MVVDDYALMTTMTISILRSTNVPEMLTHYSYVCLNVTSAEIKMSSEHS